MKQAFFKSLKLYAVPKRTLNEFRYFMPNVLCKIIFNDLIDEIWKDDL